MSYKHRSGARGLRALMVVKLVFRTRLTKVTAALMPTHEVISLYLLVW